MDTLDEPPGNPAIFLFQQFIFAAAEYGAALDWVTISIQSVIMFLGLILSAFYSGSEVAFFSLVNNLDQLNRSPEHKSADSRILKMLEKPRRLLATILIGNTFANIMSSVLAAVITGKIAVSYGLPSALVYSFQVFVLTFMILILSEITPKVIAINNPLKVSRRMNLFIYSNFIALTPISRLIADSTMSLEKALPTPSNRMTTEDIKTMAEVSEQEGSIHGDEREIIENVIEFGNIAVRKIKTSRVNIIAVSVDATLPEVIALIKAEADEEVGYNAKKGIVENLYNAGVIDPTKVVRSGLQNAASIAGMVLSTEALVAEYDEEKDENAPAIII